MPMKLHPDLIADILARPGVTIGGACRPMEETTMKQRANKYRNVPTVYNGVRYSSKSEAAYAKELDQLQAAGVVKFWIGQPKFRLGVPENVYVPDMLVVPEDGHGEAYAVDVKGIATAKFKRDCRLWLAYGPCTLRIVRKGKVAEIIMPGCGDIEDVA